MTCRFHGIPLEEVVDVSGQGSSLSCPGCYHHHVPCCVASVASRLCGQEAFFLETATVRTRNTVAWALGFSAFQHRFPNMRHNSAKASQGLRKGLHSICGDQDLLGKPHKSPVSGHDLSQHHGTSDLLSCHCCHVTSMCFAYGDTMRSSLQALPSKMPVA